MKRFLTGLCVGLCLLVVIGLLWPALLLPIGPLAYGAALGLAFHFGLGALLPLVAGAAGLGYLALGLTGVSIALLIIMLPLLSARIGWWLRLRFWEIAGLSALALVLGLLGSYLLLTVAIGDPLEALARFFTDPPEALREGYLEQLTLMGTDQETYELAVTAAVLSLREALPSLSLQTALLGGVSMAYLPIVMEGRRGVTLLSLPGPDRWFIPRWARVSLFGIYALSWIAVFSGWPAGPTLYQSAAMLLTLCFSIQGCAAGQHLLKRFGMRKGVRAAILILAFCITGTRLILAILGMLDGWLIPRKPIGPAPDAATGGGDDGDA